MTRSATWRLFSFVTITAVIAPAVRAEPIVAGDTTFFGRAIQDVTIYGGTVFNPGAEYTLAGLSGDGYFTIHRAAQAGHSIAFLGGDAL
jgi:hypothetical protein